MNCKTENAARLHIVPAPATRSFSFATSPQAEPYATSHALMARPANAPIFHGQNATTASGTANSPIPVSRNKAARTKNPPRVHAGSGRGSDESTRGLRIWMIHAAIKNSGPKTYTRNQTHVRNTVMACGLFQLNLSK